MASVDQGYANRVGFPSSLSLEPNGHISASCHCHLLSIRSGLAPSSQLLRPKLHAQSALLRRHWTICLTPGQWCAECPGVTVVCLDALWVRRTGRKSRQVRRHHLSGQAVWACLWKNHVYFASQNNQTNAVHAACSTVETIRNRFPHPNPVVGTKYTYITLLVIQQDYGKLPVYRWFNHIHYNYMFLSKWFSIPSGSNVWNYSLHSTMSEIFATLPCV